MPNAMFTANQSLIPLLSALIIWIAEMLFPFRKQLFFRIQLNLYILISTLKTLCKNILAQHSRDICFLKLFIALLLSTIHHSSSSYFICII